MFAEVFVFVGEAVIYLGECHVSGSFAFPFVHFADEFVGGA